METQTTPYGDRRRYAVRKSCEKLKAEIPIEAYLRAHGVEVRRGRAKCIVHGGNNPTSLSVDSERQIWHCHACQQGGDLLDLVQLVERHPDTWTAVVELSLRFDVPLPTRPPQWFARQEEKHKVRAAVIKALARRYQEKYIALCAPLILVSEENRADELRALEELANELWPICEAMARRRLDETK